MVTGYKEDFSKLESVLEYLNFDCLTFGKFPHNPHVPNKDIAEHLLNHYTQKDPFAYCTGCVDDFERRFMRDDEPSNRVRALQHYLSAETVAKSLKDFL